MRNDGRDLNRRSFLEAAGLVGASTVLSNAMIGSAHAQTTANMRVALSWLPNVEYAGLWIAQERNYFKDVGQNLSIISGGPNAPLAPVTVAAGRADIGYAVWLPFLDAVLKGNDFVCIGATFKVSPLVIISRPDRPVTKLEDLLGKKVLIPGPNEHTAIDATLALNHLPTDYTAVPTGFSPEPLMNGAGDALASYYTSGVMTLEAMGLQRDKDFQFIWMDAFRYKAYASMLFTTRDNLTRNRGQVRDFLKAAIHGWRDEEAEPALGAELAVKKYGRDLSLDLKQQIAQAGSQNALLHESVDPHAAPLVMSEATVTGPMYDVARASGRTNLPDPMRIFDFDIAREAAA